MEEKTDKPKFNLPGGENSKTGIGRPVGSVNIASRRAAKKLEELGFDPIAEMVSLYKEVTKQLYNMTHDEFDLPKTKYSTMAHAQLTATQQRCITELMRYGYARVTEGVEVTTQALAPVTIQLAGSAVDFDTSVLGADRGTDDNVSFKGDDE
jgi:hypothetical protein